MRAFASLRHQADFDRLRRRGRRTTTEALTIYRDDALPGDRLSRIGFSVSKSVGIAVVRNRVRRRLSAIAREAVRGMAPTQLLIVARPQAAATPFATLREQLLRVVSKGP